MTTINPQVTPPLRFGAAVRVRIPGGSMATAVYEARLYGVTETPYECRLCDGALVYVAEMEVVDAKAFNW